MTTKLQQTIIKHSLEDGKPLSVIKNIPILQDLSNREFEEVIASLNNPLKESEPIREEDSFPQQEETTDKKEYPSINTRISKIEKESLKNFAKLSGVKKSIVIREAIKEYIINHKTALHPAVRNLVEQEGN